MLLPRPPLKMNDDVGIVGAPTAPAAVLLCLSENLMRTPLLSAHPGFEC